MASAGKGNCCKRRRAFENCRTESRWRKYQSSFGCLAEAKKHHESLKEAESAQLAKKEELQKQRRAVDYVQPKALDWKQKKDAADRLELQLKELQNQEQKEKEVLQNTIEQETALEPLRGQLENDRAEAAKKKIA